MNIGYVFIGNLQQGSGVYKKIMEQIRQWRSLGNKVRIFHIAVNDEDTFCDDIGDNIFERISNILVYRISCWKEIIEFSDIIYTRYTFVSLDLLTIMKKIPTVVEINSDEISEYRLEAYTQIKKCIKYYWNFFNRKILMIYVSGKICVTNELCELEISRNRDISTIVIPNAVIGWKRRNFVVAKNTIPKLLFTGSPNQTWHGIDKILNLARKTAGQLEIFVIGLEHIGHNIPDNIHFLGYLDEEEYKQYFEIADVGIGSMALHRGNLNEACPLKVREYLSYGLPLIIGYQDTSFSCFGDNMPEWILQLPNKESNVSENIDKIIAFAKRVKGKRLNYEEIKFTLSEEMEKKRLCFFEKILKKTVD